MRKGGGHIVRAKLQVSIDKSIIMTINMPKSRFQHLSRERLQDVPLEESMKQMRWSKRPRKRSYTRLERIFGLIDK